MKALGVARTSEATPADRQLRQAGTQNRSFTFGHPPLKSSRLFRSGAIVWKRLRQVPLSGTYARLRIASRDKDGARERWHAAS